jgi:hypothetical protein
MELDSETIRKETELVKGSLGLHTLKELYNAPLKDILQVLPTDQSDEGP